ncbi:MAG: Pvc16 family protein [Egicoccus sp.]
MIEELDRSLERWLRAAVPLPSGTAEVAFEAPERDWDARRSTPLVDLFLYSLTPSKGRAAVGVRTFERDGKMVRERVNPVLEARYLISVWGGGPGVEHELLGRIVNLLAVSRAIPVDHLGDALREVKPLPTLSIAADADTSTTQLWSALGIPPRAGVQLMVETPLGLPALTPAADPPKMMQFTATNRRQPAALSRRRRAFGRADESAVGGRVVTRRGSAVIQDSGRYSVEADEDDAAEVVPPQAAG